MMYIDTAETGVALVAEAETVAEVMSEGKVLDTGVDSLPSLGLVAEGILAVVLDRLTSRFALR